MSKPSLNLNFLKDLSSHIKEIEDDERLTELLRILREIDFNSGYENAHTDVLTADCLDEVSLLKMN